MEAPTSRNPDAGLGVTGAFGVVGESAGFDSAKMSDSAVVEVMSEG